MSAHSEIPPQMHVLARRELRSIIEHIRGPEGTAVRLHLKRAETELDLGAERGGVRR